MNEKSTAVVYTHMAGHWSVDEIKSFKGRSSPVFVEFTDTVVNHGIE